MTKAELKSNAESMWAAMPKYKSKAQYVADYLAVAEEYAQSQKCEQCNVSGWLDFREHQPDPGQLVVIRSTQTGQQVIANWSRLFSQLLKVEFDVWYPLPAIH